MSIAINPPIMLMDTSIVAALVRNTLPIDAFAKLKIESGDERISTAHPEDK